MIRVMNLTRVTMVDIRMLFGLNGELCLFHNFQINIHSITIKEKFSTLGYFQFSSHANRCSWDKYDCFSPQRF